MLSVQSFEFNPFQENTYVVYDETREAIIIDPGCSNHQEQEELKKFIDSERLNVRYLLNTHGHIDHVLGNSFVKDFYRVPFLIHPLDEATLRTVKVYAPVYGFEGYREVLPDSYLNEDDFVEFGNQRMRVLFLPGHAPGHIAFYAEPDKKILAGDVLFQGSVGRTDLPGGNFDVLIQSIHQKLFALPDEVVVYPGHGAPTTIGEEKVSNPFCALTMR